MKKLLIVLFLFAMPAFAQKDSAPAAQGPFSLHASAVSLTGGGGSVSAMDVGGTFSVTKRFSLRNDELLAPANHVQAYFGGLQYFVPMEKVFSRTRIDAKTVQVYVAGGVGVDRIGLPSGAYSQHIAGFAGGGMNYDPTKSGKFSINIFEVKWAHLPGLDSNALLVSSGIKLSF